jgi:hypothetical protein
MRLGRHAARMLLSFTTVILPLGSCRDEGLMKGILSRLS